jgi:hypothetical protein
VAAFVGTGAVTGMVDPSGVVRLARKQQARIATAVV